MGINRREFKCDGRRTWRSHRPDPRKSGFRYVPSLDSCIFTHPNPISGSLQQILLKSKVTLVQVKEPLVYIGHDRIQNGSVASNFTVCIEAILRTCLAAKRRTCSSFTWRISILAMRRPYRSSTSSSSLTGCGSYIYSCLPYARN